MKFESSFIIRVFTAPVPDPWKTQAIQLGAICFPSSRFKTKQEKEEHEDRFCGEIEENTFIFAMLDNAVIGSITLSTRNIKFRNKQIILGGIGGVCTAPDQRGKGVAKKLLKIAYNELQKMGCDIAYLCTDVNDPGKIKLYNTIGFVSLHRPHTYLGKSGKRYTDVNGMIAPINSPSIFEQVKKDSEPFDIGVGNL